MLNALKRLWLLATCDHRNRCMSMVFPDTTELTICRRCGLVVKWADEGTVKNNPHLEWTEVAK